MANSGPRAMDTGKTKAAKPSERLTPVPALADAAPSVVAKGESRSAERVVCRIRALTVEFADAAGGWLRYIVPTGNISRAGLSVLTNQYVYPKTACRVHLLSLGRDGQVLPAVVVRCRYLPGTGRLHEVGLRFETPIDLSNVQRGAAECRILLCDNDPTVHQIVPRLLNQLSVQVTAVHNGEDAIRATAADCFDVVLMNADLAVASGNLAVRELRTRGYARPIVALTTPSDPQTLQRCLEAGFSQIASRPLTRESLTALVKSLQCEPIVSALAHDTALAPQIGSFVAELPEQLRRIESALAGTNRTEMQKIVRGLKEQAAALGFDVVSNAADELSDALTAGSQTPVLRDRFSQLSKVGHAARPAPVDVLQLREWIERN